MYFIISQQALSLRFYLLIYFEVSIKYKFMLFSSSSLLFISSLFSFVLSDSYKIFYQRGQISKGSRYGRRTLLFCLADFNLEWLIQHIADATVSFANEELASNYGRGLPYFKG